MDLLTLDPIHKIPGEHMDRLLAVIDKSKIVGRHLNALDSITILWTKELGIQANAVLCAAAISLFSSNDPDNESAILTLSRLWQAI